MHNVRAAGDFNVKGHTLVRAHIFVAGCEFYSQRLAVSGQDHAIILKANWEKTVSVSQTTATLQVVVNPPLRRGTPIHDNVFKTLHDLKADYVRYVPWLPYPRLGVAELEPPVRGQDLLKDFSFD